MPYYESVIIARQDLSAQQVEQLTGELTEVIKAGGGEVAKSESWGLRNLTYKIKKNRKGHYMLFDIECEKELIGEYDRQMSLNEDVLRHMIVRVEEFEEGQSAILAKPAREDRSNGRGGGGRASPRPRRD